MVYYLQHIQYHYCCCRHPAGSSSFMLRFIQRLPLFLILLLFEGVDGLWVVPVGNFSLEFLPPKFIPKRMQHNLPGFCLVIPTLHIDFLIQFDLLLRLPLQLLIFALIDFYGFYHFVTHEPAAVDHVVENGEAKMLQVDSDLVGTACNGVAFD